MEISANVVDIAVDLDEVIKETFHKHNIFQGVSLTVTSNPKPPGLVTCIGKYLALV